MTRYLGYLIAIYFFVGCNSSTEPEEFPVFENPVIGIYSDDGAHPSCVQAAKLMFQWMGYETRHIFAKDLNDNNLDEISLFYFPGGSTGPYREKITENGRNNLREKINYGCAYIGTCAGGLIACESNLWSGYDDNEGLFKIYPGAGIGPIPEIYQYPKVGMCKINFTNEIADIDNSDDCWILYYNGPYFEVTGSNTKVIANYQISNNPAIVTSTYGKGRVFLTGPHPEFEEDSDRDGETYFDKLEDQGSEWPLMKSAVKWCLRKSED